MNRRFLFIIFGVEAIACLMLAIVGSSISGFFPVLMTFPFEQVGLGLRILSLSGIGGNIGAIILYLIICLMPCVAIPILKKKNLLHIEDILLPIISILLFVVMYKMINPGLISLTYGDIDHISYGKVILGTTIYSVIFAYVVMRVLRLFFSSETVKLQKYMVTLLLLVNGLFVYLIFGVGANNLINSFKMLRTGNLGNENLLGLSYVFLILQFIVDNIPFILNIFVVFAGISLLYALISDPYSEETMASAGNLSKICKLSLIITLLTNATFNILQLIFSKMLFNINSQVQIPVFSIIFVLAVLLFSRFFAENKALKDDSDSII